MTCQEIIMELQSRASEKYKVNVARMGIQKNIVLVHKLQLFVALLKRLENLMN